LGNLNYTIYVNKFTGKCINLFGLLLLFPGYLMLVAPAVLAQSLIPTPTYDPLAEPVLPDDPTEFDLGHNLFWHWCMPCHGDQGQGLTDEWRSVWEEDHQNCWDRGCHGGRREDLGFPIPKHVPAVMDDQQLSKFSSVDALYEFLKSTHPPQSPGALTDDEYHNISVYLFAMNGRNLTSLTPEPEFFILSPSQLLYQFQDEVPYTSEKNNIWIPLLVIFLGVSLASIIHFRGKKK